MPSINSFLQPDSIIPDMSNPKRWNRYSYVENDPINYSNMTGHFKYKNNSTSFEGDCAKAVESLLTLLAEQGGQEGQALVQAFREADTVTRYGRGSCHKIKDQITITITEGEQAGQYKGSPITGNTFRFESGLFIYSNDKQKLVSAGIVAHEIVHFTQYAQGTGPFNLHAEIDAHYIQAQLYKEWGLTQADGGPVNVAETIGDFKEKSDQEIMNAPWAVNEYRVFPLNEGGWRAYDDWKYTRWKYRWNRFYKPIRDLIQQWLPQ